MTKRRHVKKVPSEQVPGERPKISTPVVLSFSPMVAAGFIKKSIESLMQAGYLIKVGKDQDGHLAVIFRGFLGIPLDENKHIHVEPVPGHFQRLEKGKDV